MVLQLFMTVFYLDVVTRLQAPGMLRVQEIALPVLLVFVYNTIFEYVILFPFV